MLNPFALPLRTVPSSCSEQALSGAKELRVNSVKHPGISLKTKMRDPSLSLRMTRLGDCFTASRALG